MDAILADLKDFIRTVSSIQGYVWCILWGSHATHTADQFSDYDLRIIVQDEVLAVGYDRSHSDKDINYMVWSLDFLLSMPEKSYQEWNRGFFIAYSQAVILDEKGNILSTFIQNLEKDINLSECPVNPFTQYLKHKEIQKNIDKIILHNVLSSTKLYDKVFVDQVLIDIFNRYAAEIGYDRYLDLWWRSKAEKRLYDQNYAEANHGWLFPDMEFVQLREKVYGTRSMEIFNQLLEHIRSKIEKKEKLPILYANER